MPGTYRLTRMAVQFWEYISVALPWIGVIGINLYCVLRSTDDIVLGIISMFLQIYKSVQLFVRRIPK